ncbi:MAG: hypothetical protein QGG34_06415 [SAR202 cluster bacterium]|mgnify:FL=1|jgi:hypothetical protein|nr:hypothetical protein [SAR202 cluster bacterium]MDP7412521.1 hypothetical protein [SAR202 cluster bacterium]MDP7532263.1 hypothetical protein [SAR202 cluster bacterium]|tara:strand:+ start:1434 stop:1649 length:216 start_codon:yes stop_codon:yes gene_type:complete
MPSDVPQSVLGEELPRGVRRSTVAVDVEHVEKMLHRATRNQFEVFVDEPPTMGGDDNYPQPLTYIAMGIGA